MLVITGTFQCFVVLLLSRGILERPRSEREPEHQILLRMMMMTKMVMMMVKVVLMEIIIINRKMMFSMHEEEGSHIDIKST